MKFALVGIVMLAFAGAASLNGLKVSQAEPDKFSGKVIFVTICARCHGIDGKGEGQMRFTPPVADLTSPAIQGKLNASLFENIHNGKPNTAMEAWGEELSEDEINDTLAYVRTLAPEGAGGTGSGLR